MNEDIEGNIYYPPPPASYSDSQVPEREDAEVEYRHLSKTIW